MVMSDGKSPVAGESDELRKAYVDLLRRIRRGEWNTLQEVMSYLDSTYTTYPPRLVYFGAAAWNEVYESNMGRERQPRQPEYKRHDVIRYTRGPLGTIRHPTDDTAFIDGQNAGAGQTGHYVEPIEILNEQWHITSVKPARWKRPSEKRSDNGQHNAVEDGKLFEGPYVLVTLDMIEHHQVNHAAIEGREKGEGQ